MSPQKRQAPKPPAAEDVPVKNNPKRVAPEPPKSTLVEKKKTTCGDAKLQKTIQERKAAEEEVVV